MEIFIGFIASFGFNYAPRNWSMCQGQLFNIADNSALFALVNTFYGGDGRITGGIPEMRGRTAVGYGNAPGLGPYAMGQKSGYPTSNIQLPNMPSHTHIATVTGGGGTASGTLQASQNPGSSDTPQQNDYLAATKVSRGVFAQTYVAPADKGTLVTLSGLDITGSSTPPIVTNSETGAGQPISIMQPYQTVNYCMSLLGLFPSRN